MDEVEKEEHEGGGGGREGEGEGVDDDLLRRLEEQNRYIYIHVYINCHIINVKIFICNKNSQTFFFNIYFNILWKYEIFLENFKFSIFEV